VGEEVLVVVLPVFVVTVSVVVIVIVIVIVWHVMFLLVKRLGFSPVM
jgi:hypothetical protein